MNKVIIHGVITRDPFIKDFSANGEDKKSVSFALAVASNRKTREGTYATDFINCNYVVPAQSKITDYLKKGVSVMVAGAARPRSFKNKDGKTIYTTDVVVDRGGLELMGSGGGVNIAVLSGHLSHDVEIRTSGDHTILRFDIACRRPFKNKDGEYDADFIPVSYARKNVGKLPDFLHKGAAVSISGSVHAGRYQKDGEWKEFFSVNADKICLAGKKNKAEDEGISIPDNMDPSFYGDYESYEDYDDDDGEVPF